MKSRLMIRTLLFAALCLTVYPIYAQRITPSTPVEIRGQVRYTIGGAPAFNVQVRLERFSGGIVGDIQTDRSGRFRFAGLSPAQYIVTVHYPGYKDVQQSVDLQTSTTEFVYLQLAPDKNATPSTSALLAPALLRLDASVPPEAQKEFTKGLDAVLDKKLVEGVGHLQKALALYPNFLEAQMLLGTAYMDEKDWGKSETALRRALEINPKATTALFALGECYRQQKKFAEAEKVLLEGLKLDDHSAQGHLTLGRVYWEKNDLVKAGPQVGRALQLKPDFADAHLLAGNILLRARQAENALVEFEEYLRLAPKGEYAEQARQIARKIKETLPAKKK
jgi:tetratricopeptide (TPR) repeat protein